MTTNKTEILVYADWLNKSEAMLMGVLTSQQSKGKTSFSFKYNNDWLKTQKAILLDPDILWNEGNQFPIAKNIFGMFNDCMPDTWGRTLMKRREAIIAKEEKRNVNVLRDIDFLLGVNDESRMGALRFKLNEKEDFVNNDKLHPTPPWTSIRELQHGVSLLESDKENKEVRKWLHILLAPGSSLGGARPKANVKDEKGSLWIAKFPSKNDTIDKAAWEYLAYKLAITAGIEMSESKIEKVNGKHHTFFTKRFDRIKNKRIHFASAMTMTGNNEDTLKNNTASYLDIAEFIQFNESNNKKELHQLWRRLVFNIAVSNTDDHLRNHGFILNETGWQLSPAFDINPSIDKSGLAINIDQDSNELNFNLAKSVGQYFQLNKIEMENILNEVCQSVKNWKNEATKIGISKAEQKLMESAFRWE